MRQLLLLILVGAALSTGVAQASTPKDYARGSGTFEVQGVLGSRFSFNVESNPAGEDVRGTMRVISHENGEAREWVAEVTCLHITPNPLGGGTATIVGDVTKQDIPRGDGMVFTVTDSGQPNGAGDRWGVVWITDSLPAGTCPVTGFSSAITSGDVTVFDQ